MLSRISMTKNGGAAEILNYLEAGLGQERPGDPPARDAGVLGVCLLLAA
ncbi:MAG: hypothetical protein JWR68_172 [Polaromonas sp.]|nr:hypothetical protein [Polaromonas sp.]